MVTLRESELRGIDEGTIRKDLPVVSHKCQTQPNGNIFAATTEGNTVDICGSLPRASWIGLALHRGAGAECGVFRQLIMLPPSASKLGKWGRRALSRQVAIVLPAAFAPAGLSPHAGDWKASFSRGSCSITHCAGLASCVPS